MLRSGIAIIGRKAARGLTRKSHDLLSSSWHFERPVSRKYFTKRNAYATLFCEADVTTIVPFRALVAPSLSMVSWVQSIWSGPRLPNYNGERTVFLQPWSATNRQPSWTQVHADNRTMRPVQPPQFTEIVFFSSTHIVILKSELVERTKNSLKDFKYFIEYL